MKRIAVLLACVLGFALAGAAQIQNGSFETPPVTLGSFGTFSVQSQGIKPWIIVGVSKSDNVLVVSGTYTLGCASFLAQDLKQWLDLTGAGSNKQTTGVQQTVPTIPGHVYQLTFWVGNINSFGGTTSTVDLSINNGAKIPFLNPSTNPCKLLWQPFSYAFTAGPGNSTTITFFNGDGISDQINGLDNVALTDLTAANCVQPPNTTMVAWYPFDELTGTTSANLATANTGRQQNGPLGTTSGYVGPAAQFNGFDQWVQSSDSIVTNIGPAHNAAFCSPTLNNREGAYSTCRGNFSIDAWLYVTDLSSSNAMTILSKEGGSSFFSIYGYGLFFDLSTQKLVLELADGVATDYFSLGPLPLLNQWNHIAVTVDRTSTTGITFYVNGVFAGNANPTARSGSLVNRGGPLAIGASDFPFCCRNFFSGKMDELEIHNRVLTKQEILDIVNAGQYGKCKP